MKKVFFGACLAICSLFAYSQNEILSDSVLLKPVEVYATKAGEKAPFAKTELSRKAIERNTQGQDLPFILKETPSVQVFSDAGNGIGYTGLRIRGTDATRINVTLNNIPYNDAESQGTYFVDLPDFSASASGIQIQRGAGSSTNGTGAFGASINISTNDIITQPGVELDNNAGSYQSFRNSLTYHSGLMGKKFTLDARLSNISSDGYIDRASSRLHSFYTSLALVREKYSLRLNIFSGKEKTYQAWYGVSEDKLWSNPTYNLAGTEKPDAPYDNETDNYTQTHYQFFWNYKWSAYVKASAALFLTRGKGYYEQYKADEYFSNYGLPDFDSSGTLISQTDLIRRLWLDNYFYGTQWTLEYKKNNDNILSGAGWTRYDGNHFGEIIWAQAANSIPPDYRWYQLNAHKQDVNLFSKWEHSVNVNWLLYLDLQGRFVNYNINGFRYNPDLVIQNEYIFFNPKAGIRYSKKGSSLYLSFAKASKEPNRDDFESGRNEQPKPEHLYDLEAGWEWKSKKTTVAVNAYHMNYRDQLILTGKINDVGAYTRTNIPNSYRTGLELSVKYQPAEFLGFFGTATFSRNKIRKFTEYLDDYDNGTQRAIEYRYTDLAFSPSFIASSRIDVLPFKNAEINIFGNWAGRQFLDNTSRTSRSLDPYFTTDIRVAYNWKVSAKIDSKIYFRINNVFSEKYAPNGYTFSYFYERKLTTENYYYPMAPLNWMAGLKLSL